VVHGQKRAGPREHAFAHGVGGELAQFLAGIHQQAQARRTTLRLAKVRAHGQGAAGIMGRVMHG
jgi:hypothetical protein